MGGGVPKTWWGFLIALAIGCLSILVALYISIRLFARHLQSLVRKYDENCDPQAFLLSGLSFEKTIRDKLSLWDAWFLCYWALALDDVGYDCEAELTIDKVLTAASEAKSDALRAEMELHIYAAVLQVCGEKNALVLLDRVTRIFSGHEEQHGKKLLFIENERRIIAEESDILESAMRWRTIRENSAEPMRIRVNAALHESDALESGDFEDCEKIEALQFAWQNGPLLKAGREAGKRLERMNMKDA